MSNRNRYFQKFPLTEYDGKPALNITRRVAFNENVKGFITAFYTHTIPADERIETLAYNYYDDVDLDWLIYHANDIVDPYFQTPLTYQDFDNFIISKYGSIENAKQKTIHYKNNYESDSNIISTSAYNALPANEKKYYQPVLGAISIAGYERAEVDFIVSTNKLETFEISSADGEFIKDEIIQRTDDESSFAEVASSNSTNIIIHHVRGDFFANTDYTIVGKESNVVATVNANSFQLLQNVIPRSVDSDAPIEQQFDESVYYSPVSFYDYEEQLNEERREIYLVDTAYKQKLNDQLKELMK